ncbi:MAG: hypothetical protein LAO03_00030 [Acidobacteriia bacterium]|nr:hypothetical protein [Terriglobia bacterium]
MKDLWTQIAETEEICLSELRKAPFAQISEKLVLSSVPSIKSTSIVHSLAHSRDRRAELAKLAGEVGLQEEIANSNLQRVLLLRAALVSLEKLDHLPVEQSVKRLICEEFQFFAKPAAGEMVLFDPQKYSFLALCKIAVLQRFPAGQFHWEISGFPRSWLFKVPRQILPRVAYFLAAELGGFAPCFVPHMATRRKNRLMLLEKESNKSWFRMASSAQLWPGIRGLVASSWLHSPDTYRVSPHLSFINKPFVESGALVTTMGIADESAGYLAGSAQRREQYKSGKFKPTLGLVLWSRKQMMQSVHRHPEFNEN